MMSSSKVLVVGAGVVGAMTALALQERGYAVTLVDRNTPGNGCSFGNAGNVSPGGVVPYAMPGTLLDVPRWVLDRTGPLAIRAGHLPRLTPWLVGWLKASQPSNAFAVSRAMHAMHAHTFDDYLPLLAEIGEPDLIKRTGQLYVSRRPNGAQGDALVARMREAADVHVEPLAGPQIREVEPAVSPKFVSGLYLPGNGNCANPHRLVTVLAEAFARRGGTVLQGEVTGFEMGPSGPSAARLADGGQVPFDHLVAAAGAWSRKLVQMLGVDAPLEAERGYHVTLPDPGVMPKRPVTDRDRAFATAPMELGLRIAGTAEFAEVDATPDWRRAEILLKHGADLYPGLKTEGHTRWMGPRPSMPDGLPVVDRSPHHANVVFVFGNGHFGLTAAPMMGRLAAELVSGTTPSVDIAPYRITRFGGGTRRAA
ncbi:NAD(P)/FAD-dependent oxidoreductase [Acuticoccus mangrovi]|uniref:FAD-dependent oxidoreductase n=1 Tax=Acuticoccus mangrovi TaxID=2796142 RepID=A0A934IQR5_9HYPH|nr:FAD-dependent oxidoreductase [Acuticoccus mangrovi]MBJ3776557.1 FAD-dependent oxidoreductase [Acuticoccus mangrovi]